MAVGWEKVTTSEESDMEGIVDVGSGEGKEKSRAT